jgi:hypothetical protein
MFNQLIYPGRGNNLNEERANIFDRRIRKACDGLALCFDLISPENDKILGIKNIDILDVLRPDNHDAHKIPEAAKENPSLAQIVEIGNYRGYLIASVLLIGQYIVVLENTRKSVQELIIAPKDWTKEIKIMSSFMAAFNECNHKITDTYFNDTQFFIDNSIVTQSQIDAISVPFTSEMTQQDKD